jgi:PEP-CTERM motif
MAKRLIFFFLAAAVILAMNSTPAMADPVSVTLTGVSGGSQGGVYTSPYFAAVGGASGVAIVCDDFSHDVYIGETWTAYVYNFSNLSGARFYTGNETTTLQLYDEAAWLITELASDPSASGNISFAIWAIFTPSVEGTAGFTPGALWWLDQAEDQTFYSGEYSNFLVLTPADPGAGSPQEYIVMTPEPSTLLLLGAGFLAIAFGSRRTKIANQLCS